MLPVREIGVRFETLQDRDMRSDSKQPRHSSRLLGQIEGQWSMQRVMRDAPFSRQLAWLFRQVG